MAQPELDSGHIRVALTHGVLRMTIDRADKRNALTGAMYADMQRVVDHVRTNDEVRTLLIDSAGDMFCAGNDISDFAKATPESRAESAEARGLREAEPSLGEARRG